MVITVVLCNSAAAFANTVTLAWDPDPIPNLAGYRLYYGTKSNVFTQNIDVGNATSASVPNLTAGTTYFFAVTAYNTLGLESPASNQVSTTIPYAMSSGGSSSVVPSPVLLSVTQSASDAVDLAWSEAANAGTGSFQIVYDTDPAFTTPSSLTVDGSSRSATIAGLVAGENYYFAIRFVTTTGVASQLSTQKSYLVPTSQTPTTIPKVSTLTDDFNNNSLDTSKWMSYHGANYVVAETNQRLELINNVSSSGWGGIWSDQQYDATDSELRVNLVQPGQSATYGSIWSWIKLKKDNANAVEIGVRGGSLYAKKVVGGSSSTLASSGYNAAAMQWLRIRESRGTTYWEYSSSYQGPWNVLFATGDPINLSSVLVELGLGAWPGTSGSMIVDNINTNPNAVSTAAPIAKLSSLSDDFSNNSLDGSKWTSYFSTNYLVSEVNQHLEVVDNVTSSGWGGIWSNHQYDATDSELRVHLVQPGGASIYDGIWSWIKLKKDNSNSVEIGIRGGSIYAKKNVAGSSSTLVTRSYDSAAMQWLRIRESGASTYWEYASSYQGPWTELFATGDPINLSAVSVELGLGSWPGTSGTMIVDNINTAPLPASTPAPGTTQSTSSIAAAATVSSTSDTTVSPLPTAIPASTPRPTRLLTSTTTGSGATTDTGQLPNSSIEAAAYAQWTK